MGGSATTSNRTALFLLSVHVILLNNCDEAFQIRSHQLPSSRTLSSLAAVFYGMGDDEDTNTMMSSNFDFDDRKVPSQLQSQDWTAPLARLATARSSGLKIEHIHQVSVGRVDTEKVDIEAIVCERDDCVSLSVPVELPEPCTDRRSDESFERCIVENLEALDQAHQEASSNTVFATEEDIEQAHRINEELTSSDDIEYPSWWVDYTGGTESAEVMLQECATLRSILNEAEFQSDLMTLVSTRCVFQENDIHPGQVFVVEVGLSGVVVRATALKLGKLLGITEIPIQFEYPATNTDGLRELVLNTVEQQQS